MTKQLHISSTLSLPLELAARTQAILAQKGAGKTYAGMKETEEMLAAGVQVVVLDPTGVWHGLRSSADGKSEGFSITVMGGDHADIPLEPTAGEVVANFVVDSGRSVILDLSGFESNAAQDRFVTAFAEKLYRRKAGDRGTLHLMLDEADSFMPQRPMPGQQRMLGAFEAIVRRGRSRGLGLTMISQRPAVLNKNVLTQADLLVCLRVIGVQDHKALEEWTAMYASKKDHDEFMRTLPMLENGEAWFWSPSWLGIFKRAKIGKRKTFDSSRTPKPGEVALEAKVVAPVDLNALSAQIQATVEKQKSNDPKELKAEIAKLRAQVAAAESSAVPVQAEPPEPTYIDRETSVLTPEDRTLLASVMARLGEIVTEVGAIGTKLQDTITIEKLREVGQVRENGSATLAKFPPILRGPTPGPFIPPTKPMNLALATSAVRAQAPTSVEYNGTKLGPAHHRILKSLFWLQNEERSPAKVAFFAGYTVNGHFNNTLGNLRSAGLVEGWSITGEGKMLIPANVEPKPTGAELREWMRPKLEKLENEFLDALISIGGRRVSMEELCSAVGKTVNGHTNNTVGHMRTIQIIEGYAKDGGIKVADVFLE